ncbi:hypothetical protein ACFQ9X_26325 [Catenulispora yoronensis]
MTARSSLGPINSGPFVASVISQPPPRAFSDSASSPRTWRSGDSS